jgi:hypothetical protein
MLVDFKPKRLLHHRLIHVDPTVCDVETSLVEISVNASKLATAISIAGFGWQKQRVWRLPPGHAGSALFALAPVAHGHGDPLAVRRARSRTPW